MRQLVIAVALLFFRTVVCAQSAPELPKELEPDLQYAISMVDEGHPDDALAALKALDRKTPGLFVVHYEMALAHYVLGEYDKSIGILKSLESNPQADAKVFQLEGNAFDMIGRRADAIRLYRAGLSRFPHSASLHLELGVCAESDEDYPSAISHYEAGISADPSAPSCYYRLALLHFATGDAATGVFHAEMFRLLEPHSSRSSDASIAICTMHRKALSHNKNGGLSLTLGNSLTISKGKMLPSLSFIYAFAGSSALTSRPSTDSQLSLQDIVAIKRAVLDKLPKLAKEMSLPLPERILSLLAYERRIADAGLWEPYVMWLLMYSDMAEMQQWMSTPAGKGVERFAEWYEQNPFL